MADGKRMSSSSSDYIVCEQVSSADLEGAGRARQFTLEYWVDDDWYVGRLKFH